MLTIIFIYLLLAIAAEKVGMGSCCMNCLLITFCSLFATCQIVRVRQRIREELKLPVRRLIKLILMKIASNYTHFLFFLFSNVFVWTASAQISVAAV